ncbi:MAG: hypothetical protein ACLQU5_25025 [Isosphaeraceae bacterium]
MSTVNGSRPIKRQRRSKTDMAGIAEAIANALAVDRPMTVRQLFYRLVSQGAIGKTEAEYKSTVIRLVGGMRRAGVIPFSWIADNSRWMRKPRTHSSLGEALRQTAETYRRAVWDEQDAYVEVWLEKDALAGVLYEITEPWDVPLMVTRGYASISYLHSAAETIRGQGKPAFLYYFGDYDPSGLDITRAVEDGIREFAPDADITFSRVAVNPEQIASMGLETRPTKKSDSRSKNFEGESVEVDAIPPSTLRRMAEYEITQHIDRAAHERLLEVEQAERETLERIAAEGWS